MSLSDCIDTDLSEFEDLRSIIAEYDRCYFSLLPHLYNTLPSLRAL